MTIEQILNNLVEKQEKKNPKEHLKGLVVKNPPYVVFALDPIPKNFDRITKKDILFLKKMIKDKNLKQIKSHYNVSLTCQLDVYLEDTRQNADSIIGAMMNVFEGVVFKNRKQVKEIKIKIIDVKKDPYNEGAFIGVVIRKFEEG